MAEVQNIRIIVQGRSQASSPSVDVVYDTPGGQKTFGLDDDVVAKVVFSSGVPGELWYDVVEQVEAREGLSE